LAKDITKGRQTFFTQRFMANGVHRIYFNTRFYTFCGWFTPAAALLIECFIISRLAMLDYSAEETIYPPISIRLMLLDVAKLCRNSRHH
jgi:hypothetical protein